MAKKPATKAAKLEKVHKEMRKYKEVKLHSGSKDGPKVKSRKQAIAIAMSVSGMVRRSGQMMRRP